MFDHFSKRIISAESHMVKMDFKPIVCSEKRT